MESKGFEIILKVKQQIKNSWIFVCFPFDYLYTRMKPFLLVDDIPI